jgi:hypothetical protein
MFDGIIGDDEIQFLDHSIEESVAHGATNYVYRKTWGKMGGNFLQFGMNVKGFGWGHVSYVRNFLKS